MAATREDVLAAFTHFWTTYADRKRGKNTIEDLIPLFDRPVSSIGTGDHEIGKQFDEVLSNFKDDFDQLSHPLTLEFSYQNAHLITQDTGYVEAEGDVLISIGESEEMRLPVRISTVFHRRGTQWLFRHNHISVPFRDQDIGEAFPMDALKAQNNRLKLLVEQRTLELREKGRQLQQETEKKERLLLSILPQKVAYELLENGSSTPAMHEMVSVLFTDFKGFTEISARISPDKLINELNDIFANFDNISKEYGLEKIKTIGDSYMAVCGLPEANDRHAQQSIGAAKEMLDYIEKRNQTHDIQWEMRIGIHSGPVVAGVVGNYKFSYDLWGDTVNLASRMESAGTTGQINISEATYQLVKDSVSCNRRGLITSKNNQQIEMYYVQ